MANMWPNQEAAEQGRYEYSQTGNEWCSKKIYIQEVQLVNNIINCISCLFRISVLNNELLNLSSQILNDFRYLKSFGSMSAVS